MHLPGNVATSFLPTICKAGHRLLSSLLSTGRSQRAGGDLGTDRQVMTFGPCFPGHLGSLGLYACSFEPLGEAVQTQDQKGSTWLYKSLSDLSNTTCVAGKAAHPIPGVMYAPQPQSTVSVSAPPSSISLASPRELQGLRCNHSPDLLSIYFVQGSEMNILPGLSSSVLTSAP